MLRIFKNDDVKFINEILDNRNYKLNKNSICNPFFRCIVYELDEIKGALIFQHIYDRIEIDYIIVKKEDRCKKIASKLMDYLINYCLNEGIDNITLEVNINNIEAINLYKKYKFQTVSKRTNYYGEYDAMLMMRKFDKDE